MSKRKIPQKPCVSGVFCYVKIKNTAIKNSEYIKTGRYGKTFYFLHISACDTVMILFLFVIGKFLC